MANPLTSLLEAIKCDLKEYFYFNIDKNNFKQKEIIKILEKYYNAKNKHCKITHYKLTNYQLRDALKPQIEKYVLQKELKKTKINIKSKNNFI